VRFALVERSAPAGAHGVVFVKFCKNAFRSWVPFRLGASFGDTDRSWPISRPSAENHVSICQRCVCLWDLLSTAETHFFIVFSPGRNTALRRGFCGAARAKCSPGL